jgi:hypothetical protein
MAERRLEIAKALQVWDSLGKRVMFVTLTLSHTPFDTLDSTWDAVQACWNRATGGKGWNDDKATLGVHGYVRLAESTYTDRGGWHVHIHALLFVDKATKRVKAERIFEGLRRRWESKAFALGRVSDVQAQDWRWVRTASEIAAYFTTAKNGTDGAVLELTTSMYKKGKRADSRTPWGILDGAIAGSQRDLGLWKEWETCSHGRRTITWSKGLRDLIGLGAEISDAQIVETPIGSAADTFAWLDRFMWDELRHEGDLLAAVLDAAESDVSHARALLDTFGIGYDVDAPATSERNTDLLWARQVRMPRASLALVDTVGVVSQGARVVLERPEPVVPGSNGTCWVCGLPLDPVLLAAGVHAGLCEPI